MFFLSHHYRYSNLQNLKSFQIHTPYHIYEGNFASTEDFKSVLRVRIRMFLGFPDPDPLITGMDSYGSSSRISWADWNNAWKIKIWHKNCKTKFLRMKIMCLRVSYKKKIWKKFQCFVIDLQGANKKIIFIKKFFCWFLFEGTFTSFFKDKKLKRSHKAEGIKGFPHQNVTDPQHCFNYSGGTWQQLPPSPWQVPCPPPPLAPPR